MVAQIMMIEIALCNRSPFLFQEHIFQELLPIKYKHGKRNIMKYGSNSLCKYEEIFWSTKIDILLFNLYECCVLPGLMYHKFCHIPILLAEHHF